ncbi:cysteine desulfurase family protein [Pirellulaceae bacterium SH449]
MIYFDNNATSLIDTNIAERMLELYRQGLANPSSQHRFGRVARQLVEGARDRILAKIGACTRGMSSDQLLFTSGGTEANNLAVFGLAEQKPGAIVVSAIEHPSVLGAAEKLESQGRVVHRLPVSRDGVVDLSLLKQLLERAASDPIALVSIMAANNETGVIQPIQQAAQLCREHGVLIHSDAVQMLGKESTQFEQLGLDAMTITAHKLHGPVGVGALVLKNGVSIGPQLFGGFQQLGLRPGTEPPVLADAFANAVERFSDIENRKACLSSLRNTFETLLLESVPNAMIVGASANRLPHTSSVAFPELNRQAIQVALDLEGLACSTGSACASGSSQPSHVLVAMGLPMDVVNGGLRFSFSHNNTLDEVKQAVQTVRGVVNRLANAAGKNALQFGSLI